jgi:Acetyltransferases
VLLCQLWPSRKLDSVSLAQIFKRMLASTDFFACCSVSNNRINGFVSGYFVESLYHDGLVCQLCCLVVEQEARGTAIGTLLMDAVKHLAHKKGCGAI